MADCPAITPIFGDAYLADTTDLSTEEHGAYYLLILAAWRQPGCSLPDDHNKLARIVRATPRRWAKIAPAVMAFWQLEDGRWTQKRLKKEWLFAMKKSAQNAEAAARWGSNTKKESKNVSAAVSDLFEPEHVLDDDKSLENRDTYYADAYANGMPEGMRPLCPSTSTSPIETAAPQESLGTTSAKKSIWVLPPDIPPEPWAAFLEMRREQKKKPTDRAKGLIIAKLRKLKANGHDPTDVLNQSTMHNWTGIFPIKDTHNGNHRSGSAAGSTNGFVAACNEALDNLGGATARAPDDGGRGEAAPRLGGQPG